MKSLDWSFGKYRDLSKRMRFGISSTLHVISKIGSVGIFESLEFQTKKGLQIQIRRRRVLLPKPLSGSQTLLDWEKKELSNNTCFKT